MKVCEEGEVKSGSESKTNHGRDRKKFADIDRKIYDVANAIQHEDLSDEMTVRSLVRRLANLAGRPISAHTEDDIVQSIINNDMPSSMDGLNRFF